MGAAEAAVPADPGGRPLHPLPLPPLHPPPRDLPVPLRVRGRAGRFAVAERAAGLLARGGQLRVGGGGPEAGAPVPRDPLPGLQPEGAHLGAQAQGGSAGRHFLDRLSSPGPLRPDRGRAELRGAVLRTQSVGPVSQPVRLLPGQRDPLLLHPAGRPHAEGRRPLRVRGLHDPQRTRAPLPGAQATSATHDAMWRHPLPHVQPAAAGVPPGRGRVPARAQLLWRVRALPPPGGHGDTLPDTPGRHRASRGVGQVAGGLERGAGVQTPLR